LGRSRGGWGSKLHLATDGNGLILGVTLTAGQTHESTQLHDVMHAVRRPRRVKWPLKLAGDKGYSYDSIRHFLRGCGTEPVIPRRANQPRPKYEKFDKNTYRKRCRVEQAVGWLKECRRRYARRPQGDKPPAESLRSRAGSSCR
jgi:IS5 family transposase